MPESAPRRTTSGLVLISASSLAFEVTLTRLFAIQQFHSFAFLVVSLAVMGFAASGTVLAFRPVVRSLASLALAYSGSVLLAYWVMNYLPFDSFAVAWDPRQLAVLAGYFISAAAPFFFAGWSIGACLTAAGQEAHRPYAANLAGSALGVPLALGAMALVRAEGAVLLAVSLGLLSSAAFSRRKGLRWSSVLLAGLSALASFRLPIALQLNLSPYKPLSLAELAPAAQTVLTRWSPSGRLDVVEGAGTHVFPGISLNADLDLPRQSALFIDGDGPIPITTVDPDSAAAEALASYMPTRLAYELRPGAKTLVLTPGAGLEALVALASGAAQVHLSRDEPLIMDALAGPLADSSSRLILNPDLSLLSRPSRGALLASEEQYDIVDFALADPFRPVTSGAFSLTEHYPLTVEALSAAFGHLSPDGLLVLTRWAGTPPSESARAWATLLAAMHEHKIEDPGEHLLAYRGMRTVSMIASRRPIMASELAAVRAFLERNAFDPVWLPDLRDEELNRHNRLPFPVYYDLFSRLLASFDRTIDEYDFNIRPPTDDWPYFFHYFRWRQTPEVLAALGLSWQPFGGSGYFVLIALLGLMTALAAGLILVPRFFARGRGLPPSGIAYFAALGAGYLLVEIPLIQRLTLLLDRPALALAVVLATLLSASGLGSRLSTRIPLKGTLGLLSALLAITVVSLPALIQLGLPWPPGPRLALAVLLLFPLGLLMGVPFASGLRRIEAGAIPWAWAINGAAAGISGVLAAMISLELGMRAALSAGALAYLAAWFAARKLWAPALV